MNPTDPSEELKEIKDLVLELSYAWNQYDDEQYQIYETGGSWEGFCSHEKVQAKLKRIKALIASYSREARIKELESLDLGINVMPKVIQDRLAKLQEGKADE